MWIRARLSERKPCRKGPAMIFLSEYRFRPGMTKADTAA